MAAYFDYEEGEHKSFINERLLAVCNYDLNVNQLETDKDFKATFGGHGLQNQQDRQVLEE